MKLLTSRKTLNATAIGSCLVLVLAGAALHAAAADDAAAPTAAPTGTLPTKEHEWLQQFVGEWDNQMEMTMEPGQPPIKAEGTESVKAIGGLWVVSHGRATCFGTEVTSVLTLGYDSGKKKYVGTWIDSMHNHMWHYEGTVDAAGKTLTLNTEGPNPADPAKVSKFKETIEFKSKDHRVFSSSIQTDDGKWMTFMTMNQRRKK
jgi:hypothetical protein